MEPAAFTSFQHHERVTAVLVWHPIYLSPDVLFIFRHVTEAKTALKFSIFPFLYSGLHEDKSSYFWLNVMINEISSLKCINWVKLDPVWYVRVDISNRSSLLRLKRTYINDLKNINV